LAWLAQRRGAGKRADFLVVDLSGVAVQLVYDPIQTMVYSASRQNVRAAYLGERETKIDPTDIVRDCPASAKRLS
jgi:cytosine/adenosine deaminase-related metal-dependent hydrolase